MSDGVLQGLSDVLMPMPPDPAFTQPAWWLIVLGVLVVVCGGLLWLHRRKDAAHQLARLANACEQSRIAPRQTAHRLAAMLESFSASGQKVPSADPAWVDLHAVLQHLRFARKAPEREAVTELVRQAAQGIRERG